MSCNNSQNTTILLKNTLCNCHGITKLEILEELENNSAEKTLKIMKFRMNALGIEGQDLSDCLNRVNQFISALSV